MTLNREARALLTTKNDPALLDVFADVLETDRRLEQFPVVQLCDAIDQMRRRYGSRDAALPAAAFDEVVDQHCDQLVGINEFGAFVENAESVGIAVGRK